MKCIRRRYFTKFRTSRGLLTKREVKGVNTRIEEFDLEGSVYDWTFLPYELIEPGLPNFAGAVRGSVNAAIFAGSSAVQSDDKAYGPGVLRRSQHQVQVAAVKPEHNLSRRCLEHGALGIDVPRPAQSPMV